MMAVGVTSTPAAAVTATPSAPRMRTVAAGRYASGRSHRSLDGAHPGEFT